MQRGPKKRYHQLIAAGDISHDPAQEEAVDLLQALHDKTVDFVKQRRSLFAKKKAPPKGLYLWGGVGRGKTLVMDLFFNHTDVSAKRRIHFHEFMAEAHDRIADWRAAPEKERKRHPAFNRKAPDDPIPLVAHDLAHSAQLLCFDEFQVKDIADAMILGRLFSGLFFHGVIIVATSNRPPGDLYKDGLNRQLFLPFIELLKERLEIHELVSAQDYRLAKLTSAPVYYQPLNEQAAQAMDAAWANMISGATERIEKIQVKGRTLIAKRTARGAARFSFAELCEQPLGASDYLALTRHFGSIFLDHIPIMGPEQRNQAIRFINLVDAIYDARVKLVCSADGEPLDLYKAGDASFEFERTASRLTEMRTEEYLAAPAEVADQDK